LPRSKIIDLLNDAESTDKSTKTTTKSRTKSTAKTAAKSTTKAKTVKKATTSTAKTAKKPATKSTVKKTATKTATKKTVAKKTEPKTTAKTTTKSTKKATSTKATTAKKATTKKTTTAKKTTKKAETKTAKKATATKKTAVKKATATKKATTAKKTTTKKPAVKKSVTVEKVVDPVPFKDVPEYYDLPYRYNHTVIKLLAQNPTTLFVYWDLNDYDRDQLLQTYGDNFFNETYPVLVIHNLTDNYTFEERIDDFANNWYIHVNDSKCTYTVELGRRPNEGQSITNSFNDLNTDYINLSWSNPIENPNDHVLFYKNHDKLYFKNISNDNVRVYEINLKDDAPLVKDIYKNYNLSDQDDRFDMNNPSSGNPTSTLKAF
jgi:hypothetical protein